MGTYFYMKNSTWGSYQVYLKWGFKTNFFPGKKIVDVYKYRDKAKMKKEYPGIKEYKHE